MRQTTTSQPQPGATADHRPGQAEQLGNLLLSLEEG